MIFRPLPLPGAFEIEIAPHEDTRGLFARIFCEKEFSARGLATRWVQMNVSLSREAGTLRGMHFQRPPAAEVKLVRCLRGRAYDVIVDLRRDSASFGRHCAVTLDPGRRNAIYVPEGFAHGFQALKPDTELMYFHSAAYAPEHEGGVNALDPALGIDWPLAPVNLSPRDRALPPLNRTELP